MVYTSNVLTYLLDPSYESATSEERGMVNEILEFGHNYNHSNIYDSDCVMNATGVYLFGDRVSSCNALSVVLLDYLKDSDCGSELWKGVDKYVILAKSLAEYLYKHKV